MVPAGVPSDADSTDLRDLLPSANRGSLISSGRSRSALRRLLRYIQAALANCHHFCTLTCAPPVAPSSRYNILIIFRQPAKERSERALIKAHADSIIHQLFQLDRSVSSAAYFLPAFEIRNLTTTVQNLRAELQRAREARLPHMPFSFSHPDALVLVTDPLQQVPTPLPSIGVCNIFDTLVPHVSLAACGCMWMCCQDGRCCAVACPTLEVDRLPVHTCPYLQVHRSGRHLCCHPWCRDYKQGTSTATHRHKYLRLVAQQTQMTLIFHLMLQPPYQTRRTFV
jgi:hypothetical protein